jgi:hypothetical protein
VAPLAEAHASNCYFFDELDDALEWVEDGVLASDPSRTTDGARQDRRPSMAARRPSVSAPGSGGGGGGTGGDLDGIDEAGPKSVATILANYVTFYEDDEMQLESFLERFKAEDTSFDKFFERKVFQKDAMIFNQNEAADAVFFILSGEVALVSDADTTQSDSHHAASRSTSGSRSPSTPVRTQPPLPSIQTRVSR